MWISSVGQGKYKTIRQSPAVKTPIDGSIRWGRAGTSGFAMLYPE